MKDQLEKSKKRGHRFLEFIVFSLPNNNQETSYERNKKG